MQQLQNESKNLRNCMISNHYNKLKKESNLWNQLELMLGGSGIEKQDNERKSTKTILQEILFTTDDNKNDSKKLRARLSKMEITKMLSREKTQKTELIYMGCICICITNKSCSKLGFRMDGFLVCLCNNGNLLCDNLIS